MRQLETIKDFCAGATYYLVKFDRTEDGDFGKILSKDELLEVDITKHEVHRSIEYVNYDRLFVFDLKPKEEQLVENPMQLLLSCLEEAKVIEMVYPNIFRWVYDGLSIKAYAIIPSGDPKQHSTITRYGGTEMFMKILKQHLENISKMRKGMTPDYNFLNSDFRIDDTEISIGSVNQYTKLYSVGITTKMSFKEIIQKSANCTQTWQPLNKLKMKYWAKEINPDFITEAKHIKLKKTLAIDEKIIAKYPQPIRALMALKHKGNYNRFLIARFLLSVHKPQDAKFMYYSVLGDEELEHVQGGNCSTQWNFIQNNMKRYGCPTNQELKNFIDKDTYKLSHPLEEIQELIGEKDDE